MLPGIRYPLALLGYGKRIPFFSRFVKFLLVKIEQI